jgi:hypothetical protein
MIRGVKVIVAWEIIEGNAHKNKVLKCSVFMHQVDKIKLDRILGLVGLKGNF